MNPEVEARFVKALADAIVTAGGARHYDEAGAIKFAEAALAEMKRIGRYAYPNLFEIGDLRFVYEWDDEPMMTYILVWDGIMWRDVATVEVPEGIVS